MADFDPAMLQALLKPQDDSPDQAMMASALRDRENLGLLAQLSGNQTAQPFAQTVLRGVAEDRSASQAAAHQAAQQRLSLAQMVEQARRAQVDDDRQERSLAESIRFHKDLAANPAMAQVWGATATQPGEAPSAPSLLAMNPRTGVAKPVLDPEGNPILQPPPKGSANPVSEKEWGELAKSIKTDARGSLSKELQKSLNSAEALEALVLGPGGQIQNLTPQQKREAYTALNSLIAKGGSNAVSQIEHLVPETLADKFANAKQYLLNEPAGSDSQALLQNVMETAAREKALALKQLKATQMQSLPNYAHLRKADPKRFDAILRGVHLDPASVDENGLEVVPAKGAAPRPTRTDPATGETRYWDGKTWVK